MSTTNGDEREEMDLDRAIELVDNLAENLAEFDEDEILSGRVGLPAKAWEDLAELMSILQIESYFREEQKEVDFSNEEALDYTGDVDELSEDDDPTEEDWRAWRRFPKAD